MKHNHSPEAPNKKELNPAIIRQDIRNMERNGLGMGISLGLVLIAAPVVLMVCTLLSDSGEKDTTKSVLLFSFCIVAGIIILARTLIRYRAEDCAELVIEEDTVSYVETDRPCTTRNGGRTRGPVYEEYLHFKSGREVQVERYKYRETDDEDFLLVAYAAEPDKILRIYRLKEYHWQA